MKIAAEYALNSHGLLCWCCGSKLQAVDAGIVQDTEDEDESLMDDDIWMESPDPPPPMKAALKPLVDGELIGAKVDGPCNVSLLSELFCE